MPLAQDFRYNLFLAQGVYLHTLTPGKLLCYEEFAEIMLQDIQKQGDCHCAVGNQV